MEYHQDWFMRQVQMMVAFLIRLLTGGEGHEAHLPDSALSLQLQELLKNNQICQGEDLLYDAADGENMDAFFSGILFYQKLAQLPEEQLKAADFSREEIMDGIHFLCKKYGISEEILPKL